MRKEKIIATATLSVEDIVATAEEVIDRMVFLTMEAEALATNTPSVDVVVPDFLVEKTCKAPCFLEITPEKTLMQDVNGILNERLEYSWCAPPREEMIECSLGEYGYMLISSDADTGLVDSIGYVPITSMHLAGVIANYGEPDFLDVWKHDWDMSYSDVTLYYNELQTIIFLEVRGRILETSEISEILFLDSKEYKKFIEPNSYHPQLPWEGYGDYP
ncbi:MAG: hypothetical protein GY755_20035 [Chloroflexi bacterium]|nr:hypothetical protein [Chloroflexota bacterium]